MKYLPLLLILAMPIHATMYAVVQTSTGASAGTDTAFIANTTNYFDAVVVPNPYFPDTFNITLFGLNPLYNPPPTTAQLLGDLISVDSYTYTDGWADGESYNQYSTVNLLQNTTGSFLIGCSTSAANLSKWFNLVQTSTTTFSQKTCEDVVNSIAQGIYNMEASSPTLVPGNWQ